MKEPQSRLTTISTGLSAFFVLWLGYRFSVVVPTLSQLLAGLGMEQLPASTVVVVRIPASAYMGIGLIGSLALIAKDFLPGSERIRLQLNAVFAVLGAMAYAWIHSALLEPIVLMMEQMR